MSSSRKAERPPVVTLLGVPNAGKSTLFNRLLGERRALVTELPGTTRDRIYVAFRAEGKPCLLCDTGGVADLHVEGLQEEILRQTFLAVEEAAVVVLVLDGRAGLTSGDRDLAQRLRPIASRVVVVWNKSEHPRVSAQAAEAFELGLGESIPLSAEHGIGIADLIAAIAARLPDASAETVARFAAEIRVAIVGRPNVGKSSLLNRLCGEARVSVAPSPGTTRDAIDTEVVHEGRLYRFVDTAGIRKPSRASGRIEQLGVMAAKRAISRADVALVVFDASEGFVVQDLSVAGLVEESGRGGVLVANKWDLVEDKESRLKALREEALARLRLARYAPMVSVSALEGQRVGALYRFVDQVDMASEVTIPTPRLNRFLTALRNQSDSSPRWRYATQVGTRPPSFLVFGAFGAGTARPHISEIRRIENRLREEFSIGPTPIRLRFRKDAGDPARGRRRRA